MAPMTPYLVSEMIDKGQLSMEEHARLENGSEWKSLEITMADAIDRSFVEVKESDISKRALNTGIPLLLCGILPIKNISSRTIHFGHG